METYSSSIRLIMVTESLSRIIQPIRSRCMCIAVPAPPDKQIIDVVEAMLRKERVDMSAETVLDAIKRSKGNLRTAVLAVQASLSTGRGHMIPEWELAIDSIIESTLASPYASTIPELRKRLFSLLANCIPPQVILESLLGKFCKAKKDMVDSQIFDAAYWAAIISRRMASGSHPIIHLETFVTRLMVIVGP
eukprot:gnl/Chilomastix_caulleri/2365.p1 GENE.gnl/Chilomastix_caulleri/2365~~gnl/Chilomastix_caulleri/2365.p1  ORF type:complete len:192 (-),score=39.33 gnl/Chilomastix_caulleri/2365:73-648(-)